MYIDDEFIFEYFDSEVVYEIVKQGCQEVVRYMNQKFRK